MNVDGNGEARSEGASNQGIDPSATLETIADTAVPVSRMDVLKAAHDGFRLRRRGQIARGVAGATAAGALVAAAVLVPAHVDRATGGGRLGHASSPTAKATTTVTATPTATSSAQCPAAIGGANSPLGADYTVKVAARFGWLPTGIGNVLNEGPANVNNDVGVSAYPPSYDAALRSTSNADPGVFLTVTPSGDADDPACHPGGGASNGAGIGGLASVTSTQSQGPTIDGQPSTWSDIVAEGQYDLTWQTSDGSTITLSMITAGLDGISSASAQADVTHIAESLQVGDISLPLPIQIKGVPAAAEMQVGQIAQAAPLSRATGATYNLGIALTFGTGNDVAQAGIEVYPASSTAESQTHETGSCAIWAGGTPNGLKICVTAQGSTLAAYLPGGVGTLLSDIVSLGTDQANWSPNLVIDTK